MPKIRKNFFQSDVVALSLVRESKPPKTTAKATSGITAKTVSTLALLAVLEISVIHVLNEASLLIEPITDITQSITTTSITMGKTLSALGFIGTKANIIIVKPQITYPQQIKSFLLPVLSHSAPPIKVETVANIAEKTTIKVVAYGALVISFCIKREKYIFSTTHAI